MTYYNTTKENKEAVKRYTDINNGQDVKVLDIIKNERKPFSASIIWKRYIHKHILNTCPITSIRRSINTLKKSGYITETGNRVLGMYGRDEREYRLIK